MIHDMLMAAAGASGPAASSDADFENVTLLLHGDGTNGAQNNTFLDSSTNNFTITRNGNTTQGTFSPFSKVDGRWGNYFDGNGDALEATQPNLSSNWTIEAWIYRTSGDANQCITFFGNAINAFSGILFYIDPSNYLKINNGVTVLASFTNLTVPINAWTHVAVVRSSGTTTGYVNGTVAGSNTFTPSSTNKIRIGQYFSNDTMFFPGYISNVRVVDGTAVYTSAFTPPTTPLTAISGTSFLSCQSNRFKDNSTNNYAITRTGDVKVTPFSPFPTLTAYDAATNGGSGYFDGTGDYLTLSNNAALDLGNSAFCIEAWVYPTTTGVARPIFNSWDTATAGNREYTFGITSTNTLAFSFYNSGGTLNSDLNAGTIVPSAWNHCVACRDASNNWALFINGSRVDTLSSSDTIRSLTNNYVIGEYLNTGSFIFTGNMSGLRVIKGSTPYDPTSTTLTVPTAPPTAVSDTQLLLNYTNAGIIDNTMSNNLETVGNAQIDTTTKKYGTGSMAFDGTGDWLTIANTPDLQLGTGNFTVEFWVYLATGDTGSNRGLVGKGGASTGWLVSLNTTQKVVFTYASSTITSSGAITTNAWNHIAVVREGTGSNQTKIYIGGTNDGTGTVSTDFNQTEIMYVGANRTGGDPMKGYIDDLRITKGKARYTSNFTPPTAAFEDIGE